MSNGVQSTPQISASESLTVAERDALVNRLQNAWKSLPPSMQAALQPILDEGHQELAHYVTQGIPPTTRR